MHLCSAWFFLFPSSSHHSKWARELTVRVFFLFCLLSIHSSLFLLATFSRFNIAAEAPHSESLFLSCLIVQLYIRLEMQCSRLKSGQPNTMMTKFRFFYSHNAQNPMVYNDAIHHISSFSTVYVMIITNCDAYANYHNNLRLLWSNALI